MKVLQSSIINGGNITINNYGNDNQDSIHNTKPNSSYSSTDIPEDAENDTKLNNINEYKSSNFYEEELIIEQNFELIQELKAKYSKSDITILEKDTVLFSLFESAGYMYQDIKRQGEYYSIAGKSIIPDKIIVVDYFDDEILYVFTPTEHNSIFFSLENQSVFYCIIFDEKYDIFVTNPMRFDQATKEMESDIDIINICLNRKGSQYTHLFRICLNIYESKKNVPYNIIPNCFDIQTLFKNINSEIVNNRSYSTKLTDSNNVSIFEDYTYYSLNKDYVIQISLYNKNNKLVGQEIIYDIGTDSNIIHINFNLDDTLE